MVRSCLKALNACDQAACATNMCMPITYSCMYIIYMYIYVYIYVHVAKLFTKAKSKSVCCTRIFNEWWPESLLRLKNSKEKLENAVNNAFLLFCLSRFYIHAHTRIPYTSYTSHLFNHFNTLSFLPTVAPAELLPLVNMQQIWDFVQSFHLSLKW